MHFPHQQRSPQETLTWIGKQLGVQSMEDWYTVRITDVCKLRGGSELLRSFGGSLMHALRTAYPTVRWNMQQFALSGWDNIKNQREFLDNVGKQLNITSPQDWYHTRTSEVVTRGGSALLRRYKGSLVKALSMTYTQHSWPSMPKHAFNFSSASLSKARRSLYRVLQQCFPECEVLVNYRSPGLVYPDTQRNVKLSFFVSAVSLAVEYQGPHHFYEHVVSGSPDVIRGRDTLKQEICKSIGITVVGIPFWSWDGRLDSLQQRIAERSLLFHE